MSKYSNLPDFIKDVVAIEAKDVIKELRNNQMRVILVPAPFPCHSGHMIRVVDSRPPEFYMKIYKEKGRKTFKRHRFMDALNRISKNNFKNSVYTELALKILLDKIEYS